MPNFSKAMIGGHAVANAKLIPTKNGTKMYTFNVGVNQVEYRTKVKSTDWYTVLAFPSDKNPNVYDAEKVTKGIGVIVTGRSMQKSYISKDGQKVVYTEINADSIELIDRKQPAENISQVGDYSDEESFI